MSFLYHTSSTATSQRVAARVLRVLRVFTGLPLSYIPLWNQHASMKVVTIKVLREFWIRYPDAKQHLEAWIDEARKADSKQPVDITAQFGSASILKNRRVVFNIKGNSYRVIVSVAYRFGALYIKFIGTHTEYDAIDAETIEMEL